MAYKVQTAKSELESMLHGTTLNQVVNITGVFNRAARQLMLDLDPQETKQEVQLGPIYQGVFDYPIPADLKGNKIIDIRPQIQRRIGDKFGQLYSQDFDLYKDYTLQPNFNIKYDNFTKSIRVNNPTAQTVNTLNTCNSVTDNGTWVANSNVISVYDSNINFMGNTGAVAFDLDQTSVVSTASIQNSTIPPIDITQQVNGGAFFLYIYLPTASNYSLVGLTVGSSVNDAVYYTATTNQDGTPFVDGWNQVKFLAQSPVSAIGSPDVTKISFLNVSVEYNGTGENGLKINNIFVALGLIMNVVYYSKYMFRDSITGVFKETTTSDDDYINLDTEALNIYLYQVALLAVQQALGQDAAYDTNFFTQKYLEGVKRYQALYKSEIQKPKTTYYRQPQSGYGKYLGRGGYNSNF